MVSILLMLNTGTKPAANIENINKGKSGRKDKCTYIRLDERSETEIIHGGCSALKNVVHKMAKNARCTVSLCSAAGRGKKNL